MPADEKKLMSAIWAAQDQIGEDFTDSLLTLSYRYLDQYYLQARRSSERSLILTLVFAVFGGLIVFLGVAGAIFWGLGTSSYVSIASGVIVNFISLVFYYLYNQTTKEMNSYYDRLILGQNLAIAVKAADLLEGAERAGQIKSIIDALLQDYNKYLFENSRPLSDAPGGAPQTGRRKEENQ